MPVGHKELGVIFLLLNSVTRSISPREALGTCRRTHDAIYTRGRHPPTKLTTLFAPRARAPRVDGALVELYPLISPWISLRLTIIIIIQLIDLTSDPPPVPLSPSVYHPFIVGSLQVKGILFIPLDTLKVKSSLPVILVSISSELTFYQSNCLLSFTKFPPSGPPFLFLLYYCLLFLPNKILVLAALWDISVSVQSMLQRTYVRLYTDTQTVR